MNSATGSRALAAAGALLLALAGCSGSGDGSVVDDALQERAGAAATAWVQEICQGRYSAAEAMNLDGTGLRAEVTEGDPDELLAQLDAAAGERLAALEADGVDTTPAVQVEGVDGDALIQEVDLSGTCFGMPFTAEDVSVSAAMEPAAVTEDIPTSAGDDLFGSDLAWYGWSVMEIDTGVRIPDPDGQHDEWALTPGEHAVRVADHFLVRDGDAGTVAMGPFGVSSPAPEIDLDPTRGAESVAAFWEECGATCVVELPGAQDLEAFTTPLAPRTVTVEDDAVTVTGVDGDLAVAVAPESAVQEWSSVVPRGWPERDGYHGGSLSAETPDAHVLEVDCPAGEACSIPLEEVTADGTEVRTYSVSEFDGTVRLTHLYPTGD